MYFLLQKLIIQNTSDGYLVDRCEAVCVSFDGKFSYIH